MWERSGTINLNWQWYLYLLYCFLYYLIHWILHPCTHTNLKLKNLRIAFSIFYPFSTYLYIPIYLSLAIFNPKFFFLLFPHLFLLIRLPLVVLLLLLHFPSLLLLLLLSFFLSFLTFPSIPLGSRRCSSGKWRKHTDGWMRVRRSSSATRRYDQISW